MALISFRQFIVIIILFNLHLDQGLLNRTGEKIPIPLIFQQVYTKKPDVKIIHFAEKVLAKKLSKEENNWKKNNPTLRVAMIQNKW